MNVQTTKTREGLGEVQNLDCDEPRFGKEIRNCQARDVPIIPLIPPEEW